MACAWLAINGAAWLSGLNEPGKKPPPAPTALDERVGISYLAVMATRLLLTLLALLTGLAAQLSPAQARIRAESASAVGTLVATPQGERTVVVRRAAPAPRPAFRRSQARCIVAVMCDVADCAPSVMLGIDRSRE